MLDAHIQIWMNHSLDAIIFMRLLRMLFFIIVGLLMLREPMQCGGRNTAFHRVLAIFFFIMTWYSWDTATARMALVIEDPVRFFSVVPNSELLFSELALTAITVLIAGKLAADYSEWRELEKLKCKRECGKTCEII